MKKETIDNLIRDITKVGFMPKSEATRRIGNLLKQERERILEEVRLRIQKMEWDKLDDDEHTILISKVKLLEVIKQIKKGRSINN